MWPSKRQFDSPQSSIPRVQRCCGALRVCFVLLVVSTSMVAQGPAAESAQVSPRPIDPVLVTSASELTLQQIQSLQTRLADWPQLGRYRQENAALAPQQHGRVVFMGDSITDAWMHRDNNRFFPGRLYVNRGISGQTTGQMLVRFSQDVVALKPEVVVILGGINDIAGNGGESSLVMIEDNLAAMTQIAQAHHIAVVLSSVLPAIDFPWRPGLLPAPKVRALNLWIRDYSAAHRCVYLDYYAAMADASGGMKPGLSKDNVHPTPAGYAIMAPLAEQAISQARQPR